jgi:hypothetical protein
MRTNTLTRYMVVGIVGVLVVLGFNAVFSTNDAVPEQIQQRVQEEQAPTATTSVETLNKISGSSDVESDLEVYIQSTETMPNPNDFNDSYSDLNR